MISINIKEYTISVNKFEEPKVLQGNDSVSLLLLRLLLLEPGSSKTNPEMGVGIISNYLYVDENEIESVKDHIKDQVQKYLPDLIAVEVNIEIYDKIMTIQIRANGQLYSFNVDNKDNTIKLDKLKEE